MGWEKLTRVDSLTQSTLIVDYAHHEIHDGRGFHADHAATLGSGEDMNIVFTTSATNREMHLLIHAASSAESNTQLLEGVTIAGDGTPYTPRNRNRNSDKTSLATGFALDDGTISGGTVLVTEHKGSGRTGGETRGDSEWVLKRNTTYAVVLTSEANTNDCSMRLDWYEHRDKRTD